MLWFCFCGSIALECGSVCALVYPIVMGRSSCCVLLVSIWSRPCASVFHSDGSFFLLYCVSIYSAVYTLVYPIVMDRSTCCIVCVCMWCCLCTSVSHSDGKSFLLCCVVCVRVYVWSRPCASVAHSDGLFFLLCCVFVCGPVYALVYPIVMGPCYCCVVFVCFHLCASVSHSDGPFFLLCSVCVGSHNNISEIRQSGYLTRNYLFTCKYYTRLYIHNMFRLRCAIIR
jgi:hypothetical protein